MKQKKKWMSNEEINFWQPASDMFSALMLILMLIILLLGLYLVHIPEHDQLDPDAGDTYAEGSEAQKATQTPEPTAFFWFPGGGGGGGGGDGGGGETPHPTFFAGGTPSASPSPTITPTPDLPGGGATGGGGGTGGGEGAGEGPGEEPDMGLKSAVYVMMIDAETERTVKIPNVEFELYGNNHSLQILNTYYPERISFRFYDTTENGTFYLPEKISLGDYELHELTEPEGYDAAPNVEFELLETYDWADPYVVQVPIYPSRNIIRIQMRDADTGKGIEGGAFDVVATENIITADGTLRYRMGQVVSEIICDETGYGESEEIYLGTYYLRQKEIPRYYTGMEEDLEVTVEKKSALQSSITQIAAQRSKVTFRLSDLLNPDRGIRDSVFSITSPGAAEPLEMVTDSSGQFVLNELEKNSQYQIKQIQAYGSYRLNPVSLSFSVSADGRIEGEPEISLEMQNYVIRVSIGVTDEFSAVQVPNVNLTLYRSADDTPVRTWSTSAVAQTFTDFDPGDYYAVMDGDTANKYRINILDQAELQEFTLNTTYILHYLIYAGIALGALAIIIIVIVLVLRRKRRRAM